LTSATPSQASSPNASATPSTLNTISRVLKR
jgi:hypothetical protein